MTVAFADTSILIHLYRKHPAAESWFAAQTEPLSITPVVWLEFMDGAPSKIGQKLCLSILSYFEVIRLTDSDQDWAMQQMQTHRLQRGVHTNDCLIASVCQRLQVPIYTHNVKDLQKLLPSSLVINPFSA